MRVRTFLFIVLAMGVVYAMASLFVSNREVLERSFTSGAASISPWA